MVLGIGSTLTDELKTGCMFFATQGTMLSFRSLSQLREATNDFIDVLVTGCGGFGDVY